MNMLKKSFGFVFAMLFVVVGAQAQFGLAVDGGLNVSDAYLKRNQPENTQPLAGYYIGARPHYSLTKWFAVGLGAQYSQKGYLTEDKAEGNRFHYATLNPQIEIRPLKFISVNLGLGASYLAKQQTKTDGAWVDLTSRDDMASRMNWDAVMGVKLHFNRFYVSAAYEYGLNDIQALNFSDLGGSLAENARTANRNVQIGVGYTFGGGR